MSKYLHWNPKISLGIGQIDLEHQTFVEIINELDEVRKQPELLYRSLLALMKYAAFHFQSEENIMYRIDYPDIEHHQDLHIRLMEQLNNRMIQLNRGDLDIDQFLVFLKKWYVEHTTKADHKILDYLISSGRGVGGF